jgi:chaperone required for assembly of F1-ATPase
VATPPSESEKQATQLPPRFYKSAAVAEENGRFRVLLDDKTIRTPAKNELALPTRALADAIAAEWEAQGARIEPATMPLTRLANSIIDGVIGREAEVRRDIAKYAESDVLCYRADNPHELVVRQVKAWNPALEWARGALGADFQVAEGIIPVRQSEAALAAVRRALEPYDAYRLAALHVMTSLMGSVLLTLAHARGRLSAQEAWTTAHIDEDWQISRWGQDAEAAARRAQRWLDMQAASRLLTLLAPQ